MASACCKLYELESELHYDWRFTANQFVLATSPLRLKTNNCIFKLNSSLERGWVVVYNCCWSSPAQSFSGPSTTELMTTFYCLRFETPRTWRARSTYLYSPGTAWAGYAPRQWVRFSSPPTTRRATVKVFEPASTRKQIV
jgi:hypothetical protein